jgi:hypothetical protein
MKISRYSIMTVSIIAVAGFYFISTDGFKQTPNIEKPKSEKNMEIAEDVTILKAKASNETEKDCPSGDYENCAHYVENKEPLEEKVK